MPNLIWSTLNSLQVGKYAEYLSKMEFTSYGFHVYSNEVDDHGIDFIVKSQSKKYYEIQVKSLRLGSTNYILLVKINLIFIRIIYLCVFYCSLMGSSRKCILSLHQHGGKRMIYLRAKTTLA
jgi:hypothetical protein